jgi:hypothetical protein
LRTGFWTFFGYQYIDVQEKDLFTEVSKAVNTDCVYSTIVARKIQYLAVVDSDDEEDTQSSITTDMHGVNVIAVLADNAFYADQQNC